MWVQAKKDISREHGGILAGEAYRDPNGRYYVVVRAAIAATGAAGTSTHLQFRSESWKPVWSLLDANPQLRIVGWYHTHPRLGAFFSRTDRRTQRAHFPHPWQIAVVLDPVSGEIGYYYGGDAERAPHVQGFRMRRKIPQLISGPEGRS